MFALVNSPEFVCCRYRLAAFRSYFEAAGHDLVLMTLPRGSFARLRLFRSLRGHPVILQRTLLPFWERAWLRRCAGQLIYDFDDAVFAWDSYAFKGWPQAGLRRRFAALVRDCDAVVAGNRFLAHQAAQWAQPGKVHVIPTCVDPLSYPKAGHAGASGTAGLVWIGSSSTLQGLRIASSLLEGMSRQIPGLYLKIICDSFLKLHDVRVLSIPWSKATEAAEIASCDIGISLVPDDQWSRGKCGLKVLQYMAAGLPVVANPVGVHSECVVHGETGYLADTAEEWTCAVRRLAADPSLRRSMGTAGRRRLEKYYSVAEGGRGWTSLLAGLEKQTTEGLCGVEGAA